MIAEWWLKSARVKRAIVGKPARSARKKPVVELSIPADVGALVESRPQEARAYQLALREQLQKCFNQKLAITGFAYDEKSARYLLDCYED